MVSSIAPNTVRTSQRYVPTNSSSSQEDPVRSGSSDDKYLLQAVHQRLRELINLKRESYSFTGNFRSHKIRDDCLENFDHSLRLMMEAEYIMGLLMAAR